jgi:hypothetical protein
MQGYFRNVLTRERVPGRVLASGLRRPSRCVRRRGSRVGHRQRPTFRAGRQHLGSGCEAEISDGGWLLRIVDKGPVVSTVEGGDQVAGPVPDDDDSGTGLGDCGDRMARWAGAERRLETRTTVGRHVVQVGLTGEVSCRTRCRRRLRSDRTATTRRLGPGQRWPADMAAATPPRNR